MCGPSTRRAASGKLAGLMQNYAGLISLLGKVKIESLELISTQPPCPLRQKSQCHKEWLHLFTLDPLHFNKTSSKRDSCGVSHRGVHCLRFLWSKFAVILVTFFLQFLEGAEEIFLHWHWWTVSAKHWVWSASTLTASVAIAGRLSDLWLQTLHACLCLTRFQCLSLL